MIVTGIQEMEVEDAALHPPVYNMAPYSKEILSPICQECVKLIKSWLRVSLGLSSKEFACKCGRHGFYPWS